MDLFHTLAFLVFPYISLAVFTVGHKGGGIQELLQTVVKVALDEHPQVRKIRIPYGHEIESHLGPLTEKAEALELFETTR